MKRLLLIFYLIASINLFGQETILDPINNGMLDSLAAHYGLINGKVAKTDSNVAGGYASYSFARNASNLALGTIPTGRLSGSYTGITGLGTVATGVWNGTAILDAYVDNDLTINSTKDLTTTEQIFSGTGSPIASNARLDLYEPTNGVSMYNYMRGAHYAGQYIWAEFDDGTSAHAILNLGYGNNGSSAPRNAWYFGTNNTNDLAIGRVSGQFGSIGDNDMIYFNDNGSTLFYYPMSLGKSGVTSGSLTFIASDNDQGSLSIDTNDKLSANNFTGFDVNTYLIFSEQIFVDGNNFQMFANDGVFSMKDGAGANNDALLRLYDDDNANYATISYDHDATKLSIASAITAFSGSATFGGSLKAVLAEYADDAAAGTAGLTAGQMYKTATGEVRIKL